MFGVLCAMENVWLIFQVNGGHCDFLHNDNFLTCKEDTVHATNAIGIKISVKRLKALPMRNFKNHLSSGAVIFLMVSSMVMIMAASPARAIVLKIATISPEGSSWMKMMRQGTDEVARKTASRVRFKFYPGGVMGDNKAVLRKIRIGQLQGGLVTSGSLTQFFSDNQVYNLPITFNSFDEVDYVRSYMDPIIIDGFFRGGFVTFGLAEGGFAYLMSKAPIKSAGDLRRHKIWIPEDDAMSLETARAFGVTPIPLSIAEVRTGLQTGLIDTVAISPIGAIALQWHTQVNYLMDTPLIYLYAVLAVDRGAFDRISPEDQKIVNDVIGRVFKKIDRRNRRDNLKAIEALQNQGIQFVKPDILEQKEWKRLAASIPKRMIESGKLSQDMLNKLEKYLSDYRAKGPEPDGQN